MHIVPKSATNISYRRLLGISTFHYGIEGLLVENLQTGAVENATGKRSQSAVIPVKGE